MDVRRYCDVYVRAIIGNQEGTEGYSRYRNLIGGEPARSGIRRDNKYVERERVTPIRFLAPASLPSIISVLPVVQPSKIQVISVHVFL